MVARGEVRGKGNNCANEKAGGGNVFLCCSRLKLVHVASQYLRRRGG